MAELETMSYDSETMAPKAHHGMKVVIHVVCIILSALSILPFWIMIVNSTRSTTQIQQHALSLIPSNHIVQAKSRAPPHPRPAILYSLASS